MGQQVRHPDLLQLYHEYLAGPNSARFIAGAAKRYTPETLARLTRHPTVDVRRAAVLAISLLGDFRCNAAVGATLRDDDNGVRKLAETGIRWLWRRDGDVSHQRALEVIVRLNHDGAGEEAEHRASQLIEELPSFAEAWNQRAVARFMQGDHRGAAADCREAIQRNPYHFAAAVGLAQCQIELGQDRSALEAFRHAIQLNPELKQVRACIKYLEGVFEDE